MKRKNRIVMEMARCIRNSKNLVEEFWAKALNTAIYLLNRSLTKIVYGITLEEAWTGAKPNIDHLRIFGCVTYAHVPDEKRSKLEDKSVKCIHIGYSEVSKAYKLFDLKKRKIILNRDVVFDEEKVYKDVINDVAEQRKTNMSQSTDKGKEIEIQSILVAEEIESSNSRQQKFPKWVQRGHNQKDMLDTNFDRRMIRQQSRVNFILITQVMKNNEPQSFDEAVNKVQWQNEMESKFDALVRNDTSTLMELPLDKDVIGTKWIYKTKYKYYGSINKNKARLVAKGYAQ
eukprot:Gb_04010 [translate_table: standard]